MATKKLLQKRQLLLKEQICSNLDILCRHRFKIAGHEKPQPHNQTGRQDRIPICEARTCAKGESNDAAVSGGI